MVLIFLIEAVRYPVSLDKMDGKGRQNLGEQPRKGGSILDDLL
jgi:hypothetical protein